MMARRVVITGIGIISPNGIGKKTFWENTHVFWQSIRTSLKDYAGG